MTPLPIDAFLPSIVASLQKHPNLVIEASPGAGKTTRVPRALLDAKLPGEIVILEPRRLAARLAARRVAEELGEAIGQQVGYQVRFDSKESEKTRIKFVTEGILTRRLLSQPTLPSVGVVILDEFHERHIAGDVALALLRRLQKTSRPDLKLIVMSATLPSKTLSDFLGDAPIISVEAKRFSTEISYLSMPDERPIEQQVFSSLSRLLSQDFSGDTLVFLPGAPEIHRSIKACAPLGAKHNLLLLPLYGDLSPEEQDRAVLPGEKRKVIFSTNVAETSITIEGVTTVIDSGLARVASHSSWSGLPTLRLSKVSKASCIQRAGRAGRTQDGRCLRLFTQHDFDTRQSYELPELLRLDLADTVLTIKSQPQQAIEWLDAPPEKNWLAAEELLLRLGALTKTPEWTPDRPSNRTALSIDNAALLSGVRGDADASKVSPSGQAVKEEAAAKSSGTQPKQQPQTEITELGRKMLRLPVHPRQARVAIEAEQLDAKREGCQLAAFLGEQARFSVSTHDPVLLIERWQQSRPQPEEAALRAVVERAAQQLLYALASSDGPRIKSGVTALPSKVQPLGPNKNVQQPIAALQKTPAAQPTKEIETALRKALFAGYPDRVGKLKRLPSSSERGSFEIVFAGGGSASFVGALAAPSEDFVVALDAETRASSKGSSTFVRMISPIEVDWLLEAFLEEIQDLSEVRYNPQSGRIEATRKMYFQGLLLEEENLKNPSPNLIAKALFEAALNEGLSSIGGEALTRMIARVSFLQSHRSDLNLPSLDEAQQKEILRKLCEEQVQSGSKRLEDLKGEALSRAVFHSLTSAQQRALEELAPERVTLPGGRKAVISYEDGAGPSISSRLQDFFGMKQGPSLVAGRAPLVLHLLAPNGRDVQVTTDLAGFWKNHYPSIAKELRRRYPRHSWPDDPLTAAPPIKKS